MRSSSCFAALVGLATLAGCGGGQAPAPAAPVGNTLDPRVSELEARLEVQAQALAELDERIGTLVAKLEALERAPAPPAPPARRRGPDPAITYAVPIAGRPVEGPADALVTIVWGHEYACPYCDKVRPTLAALRQRYGADLRIVASPFVVHPTTATATAAAACAAHLQGRHADMDRLLWANFASRTFDQMATAPDGSKAQCFDTPTGCPIVQALATQLGLDAARFDQDLRNVCPPLVAAQQAELAKYGMTGTPGFFINGRFLSGAQPEAAFATLIDEELAKAQGRVKRKKDRATYYATWIVGKGQTTP